MEEDIADTPEFDAVPDRAIGRRQGDLVELYRSMEVKIMLLQRDNKILARGLFDAKKAAETERVDHAWLLANKDDLRALVESKRWASNTRIVIAWLAGAVIGGIMLINSIAPLVRGKLNG